MTKEVFKVGDYLPISLESWTKLEEYRVEISKEACLLDFKYIKHGETLDLCLGLYEEGISLDLTHEDAEGKATAYGPAFDTIRAMSIGIGKVGGNDRLTVYSYKVGVFTIVLRLVKDQGIDLAIDLVENFAETPQDYAC